jgi:DNA-binding NtrC family response regulator
MEAIRASIHTVLEHAGYDVIQAGSGEEAIAYLANHADPFQVHAMVCDLNMPGIGGQDTIRYFKAHYPWVGVIVLTAHADMPLAYELLKLGIFQYLLKPIAHDGLRESVDRCVSDAAAARPYGRVIDHAHGKRHMLAMI